MTSLTSAAIPPALIRAELARVLASPAFSGALNAQRLLAYLAEHTLARDTLRLRESVLAVEVFQRPIGRFDPVRDSIVRVEARRLRQRLQRHYAQAAEEPQITPVRLELLPGRYVLHAVRQMSGALPAPGPESEACEPARQGAFFFGLGHEDGVRRALLHFSQAARKDASAIRAHIGMAQSSLALVDMGLEPGGVEPARAALKLALSLDPRSVEALLLLADVWHRFDHDWPGARSLFERALAIEPPSPRLLCAHAAALMRTADFDLAETQISRAEALDPERFETLLHAAMLRFHRRDLHDAERLLERLRITRPSSPGPLALLGALQLARGDADAALATYRDLHAVQPGVTAASVGMVRALALADREHDARFTFERLRRQNRPRLSHYQIALIRMAFGDAEAALDALEDASEAADPDVMALPIDPAFDALRDDPRYAALASRLGLALRPAAEERATG